MAQLQRLFRFVATGLLPADGELGEVPYLDDDLVVIRIDCVSSLFNSGPI